LAVNLTPERSASISLLRQLHHDRTLLHDQHGRKEHARRELGRV